MKRALLALGALLLGHAAHATSLRVTDVRLDVAPGKPPSVVATVQWENAWRTEHSQDGVWLFVKLSQDWRRAHGRLAASGHSIGPVGGGPKGELEVPEDRAGAFCF